MKCPKCGSDNLGKSKVYKNAKYCGSCNSHWTIEGLL